MVGHGRFSLGEMQLSGWQRFPLLVILLSSEVEVGVFVFFDFDQRSQVESWEGEAGGVG